MSDVRDVEFDKGHLDLSPIHPYRLNLTCAIKPCSKVILFLLITRYISTKSHPFAQPLRKGNFV
jgi:hypothetical protein